MNQNQKGINNVRGDTFVRNMVREYMREAMELELNLN